MNRRRFLKGTGLFLPVSPAILLYPDVSLAFLKRGGGSSDSDWPSILNRPVYNSGTNSLSWVGPSGGGANNGHPIAQSRTLSTQTNSTITTTTNGQVIAGINNIGDILVNHNNVTIQQSYLTDTNGSGIIINANAGITGLIIEDCVVDGQKKELDAIGSSRGSEIYSAIIRRNTIKGVENGVTSGILSSSITDNLFMAFGNTNSSTYDGDMVEMSACDTILIQHNTFDSASSAQASPVGVFNSSINMTDHFGPVTNITINNNHFLNHDEQTFIICDDNSQGGGAVTWTFTNNGFFNIGSLAYRRDAVALIANSGNYTAASATDNSGTLINGTGLI